MSSRSAAEQNALVHRHRLLSQMALSLLAGLVFGPGAIALDGVKAAVPDAKPAPTAARSPSPDAQPTPVNQAGTVKPAAVQSALDQQLEKYQKLIDDKSLSMDDFQKLAELADQNPTNSRVHLLMGRGFDLQGLSDQAVDQYKIADKYGPKDPEAIAAMLHNVMAKGAGEAANTLLNSAIARFPNNPDILFMIGKRLKENNHGIEASRILIKAYTSGVKVKGLPSELADLVVRQDPEKAIELAKEDLAGTPNYAPGLMALAKAEMRLGNFQLAVPPLGKLFEQAPTNSDASMMYFRSLYWCGDYQTAIEPALYCLRNDATDSAAAVKTASTIGLLFTRVPHSFVDSTLARFYDKIDQDKTPVLPPFHFLLGRVFFQQHRYGQAKAELLRYIDSDPKNAETLFMLGQIAELHDHDYATALKYYRLAHAILPYHPGIAGATSSLEERILDHNSDWAWCLKDWLASTFSWGQH